MTDKAPKMDMGVTGFQIQSFHDAPNLDPGIHYHSFFEILFYMKGSRKVRIQDKEFLAKEGDITVFFPGEVHEEIALTKTFSYIVIRFYDYDLKQLKLDFPKIPPSFCVFTAPDREELLEILNRIMLEGEKKLPGSETIRGAYFMAFTVLLHRAFLEAAKGARSNRPSGRERIDSAIGLIKHSLDKPVNLGELAKSSFLSTSYFSQEFKKKTGKSPKQFIIKEKIGKAETMLLSGGKSLKQISDELGYASESYFFRQFKLQTGLTPMEFRKRRKVK